MGRVLKGIQFILFFITQDSWRFERGERGEITCSNVLQVRIEPVAAAATTEPSYMGCTLNQVSYPCAPKVLHLTSEFLYIPWRMNGLGARVIFLTFYKICYINMLKYRISPALCFQHWYHDITFIVLLSYLCIGFSLQLNKNL